MRRRRFLQSALVTGTGSLLSGSLLAADAAPKKQELYELRTYILKDDNQQRLTESYWSQAAIPALNKLGCKNVGVFTELKPEGHTKLFVVIPFPSLEHFLTLDGKLARDIDYQMAASDYLGAPPDAAAYERFSSSLLKAFSFMPTLEVPAQKERIFELRRYESPSEYAGKKKIEMFNEGGEIEIFKKTGLTPVFFGEAIFGEARPQLTYLITFDNMEAHDKNWSVFGSDPEWKKISGMEEYADAKLITRISRTFLKPTSYSQI